METFNVGKVGNINDIDGVEIYLYNSNHKLSSIKLFNFDYLQQKQYQILNILPDDCKLNYSNCIIGLSLFVEPEYRNKGIGKKMLQLSFDECIKYKINNWIGYRYNENEISKKLFSSLNVKKLVSDQNIEVFLKTFDI